MKHDKKILNIIKQKLPSMKMLSFILTIITVITCVKLHQNPDDKFWKKVCVLFFGLMVGAGVCGIIINFFYNNKIRKIYNASPFLGNIANIFTHIIPLILILIYAPKKTNIPPINIIIFSLLFLCIYTIFFNVKKLYPGVPNWLIFGLYPIIVIASVFVKYKK